MFTTPLILEADITGDDQWILHKNLRWHTKTETYVVPKNFRTDLASIPRGLRWLLKQNGKSRRPSVLHDFLYRNGLLPRKACDELFLVALKSEGMSAGRWLYFWGVRLGGAIPYVEKEIEVETRERLEARARQDGERKAISDIQIVADDDDSLHHHPPPCL